MPEPIRPVSINPVNTGPNSLTIAALTSTPTTVADHHWRRHVVALVHARHHIVDLLDDRLRGDAVLLVVGTLNRPASFHLVHGRTHRIGHVVSVHDDASIHVAGRASGRLDQ